MPLLLCPVPNQQPFEKYVPELFFMGIMYNKCLACQRKNMVISGRRRCVKIAMNRQKTGYPGVWPRISLQRNDNDEVIIRCTGVPENFR
jgi:hypothetical protein